ncbi:acyl-CoA dehydrogenase family protein [Aliiroseovarius sp. KMU-50]|uniref:Acyl-CoA dehydrogenase family protein n=1 Tax=Aliiroseovarius salicola TaxID=3009082 RepID=A0ABT4W3M4_9RHOB|nr:acyl-CoA dehydrogenase family protein [Aliiroseovarius sp. KMU-50]MDA5095127.1 acyl-CoA dehydrogenase family protein [Aliiroseovarius sp. KMU-50]
MPAQIEAFLASARAHDEVIKPDVDAWNEVRIWPREASDKATTLGLTGLYAPEEFGVLGLSL